MTNTWNNICICFGTEHSWGYISDCIVCAIYPNTTSFPSHSIIYIFFCINIYVWRRERAVLRSDCWWTWKGSHYRIIKSLYRNFFKLFSKKTKKIEIRDKKHGLGRVDWRKLDKEKFLCQPEHKAKLSDRFATIQVTSEPQIQPQGLLNTHTSEEG